MYKTLFLAGILLFIGSCQEPQTVVEEGVVFTPEPELTDRDYGLYGIESGVVIRILKRDSSREEIYFDHWGSRQAHYKYICFEGDTTTTLWGATIHDRSLSHYLSLGNTYFSAPNNRADKRVKWDSLGFEQERKLAEYGYICTGTSEVEGKLCNVWEYVLREKDTMRSYLYKGVLLKETEYKRGKHRSKEISVTVKENVQIPEEKFTVPKNYIVKETSTATDVYERLLGH
ncbi:MAG: hypothetical protein K0S33_2127 [Bacteroidetes bacterium]|nr:hypothetical protein [Bacteroidota bacterium]